MTSSNEQLVPVEQRHRDAAAWALDKAPDSMTWEYLTAAHRTPDQLWQAQRVAKAFAQFEAALRTPPAVEPEEGLVEKVAMAIAGAIAKRHGGEQNAEDWLNDSRREEARAVIAILPSIRAQALEEAATTMRSVSADIALFAACVAVNEGHDPNWSGIKAKAEEWVFDLRAALQPLDQEDKA